MKCPIVQLNILSMYCLYAVAIRGKGISISLNRNQNRKLYKLDLKSNFIVNYAYEPE